MKRRELAAIAVSAIVFAFIAGSSATAQTAPVSVKLTTNALGLGTNDINAGSVVDADVAGKLVTSTAVGTASVLTIQRSGVAGLGNAFDPLFVTVTSRTHLDTVSGLPASNDYQAGVSFVSKESTALPDGKDEGLGVRAMKVIGATALREFDSGTGRPKVEGSKEVSGGTGPTAYDASSPNGSPHVDEDAIFTFATGSGALATQTYFTLSKFETNDKVDLSLTTTGGATITLAFQGTGNAALFEPISAADKVWKLKLSGVPGLSASDTLATVAIRAIDDDPANPAGTAEHFLITGFVTVALVDCAPFGGVTGSPHLGGTLTFTMAGGPNCYGCFVVSLDPGPTEVYGVSFPIGLPFFPIISAVLPPQGVVTTMVTIPNDPFFIGLTFYGAVGLANPSQTIVSAYGPVIITILP